MRVLKDRIELTFGLHLYKNQKIIFKTSTEILVFPEFYLLKEL